jgi:uncharacterized membrane protein YbhN (UPF0104 family)
MGAVGEAVAGGTRAQTPPVGVYRPRQPRASPLYRLLDEHFRTFTTVYDERFAPRWGPWRRVGAVFLAALLVVWLPGLTGRIARAVFHALLPERWATRALGLVDGLVDGLDALRAPGRLAGVLFWSVVLWLTNAASFWLAFVALGLDLSWGPALVLQGILAFGVALPSSPGFFGVFEGAARAALALYGIPAVSAASLAIGYHIAGFIPITVLGLGRFGTPDCTCGI